jgi:hypothetical protein
MRAWKIDAATDQHCLECLFSGLLSIKTEIFPDRLVWLWLPGAR